MAALGAPQVIPTGGVALTLANASAGGDTVVADDRGVLVVQNLDASSTTVTIASTRSIHGLAIPARGVPVAAGAIALIPISKYLNADGTGAVALTYSKVTGPLKVGYIQR